MADSTMPSNTAMQNLLERGAEEYFEDNPMADSTMLSDTTQNLLERGAEEYSVQAVFNNAKTVNRPEGVGLSTLCHTAIQLHHAERDHAECV